MTPLSVDIQTGQPSGSQQWRGAYTRYQASSGGRSQGAEAETFRHPDRKKYGTTFVHPRKEDMKTGMKLLSMAGAIFAAGALAASPLVASANDGDVDAAVFAGETTTLTQVQLVGGSGSFTFDTTHFEGQAGQCVGVVSTDNPPSTLPEVAAGCSIGSTGGYSNIVCGTGTASGTATLGESDGSDTYGIGIIFVAGLGVVTSPGLPAVPNGGLVGVVQLLPSVDAPIASPPGCVNAFSVVGVGVSQ
jgi:hypothetical protein